MVAHVYIIILILSLKIDIFSTQQLAGTCDNVNYTLFKNRGSTTLYEDVRGHGNLTNKGCNPQQIWSLIRHGIRYNDLHSVNNIKKLLSKLKVDILIANAMGKGAICVDDLITLQKWRFDELMTYEANFVTESGKKELTTIGKRIRDNFPTLLNITYDHGKYYFGYSSSQRAIQSMRSFTEGVFENDQNYESIYAGQWDKVSEDDCHQLKDASLLENNMDVHPAAYKFAQTSNLFSKISASLSHRTGLPQIVFNKTLINTLFESCVYESARDLSIAPWCRVFTLEDLQLMVMREENLQYFSLAYGSNNSDLVACTQMKSLIHTFNDTVQNKSDGYIMKAFFTQDSTLQTMFTRMGCFNDSAPISPDYAKYNFSKLWNMGKQTPFAANLIAVLYKCNNSNYELQFFLNENPVGCCMNNSKEACSWNEFISHHNKFVSNCKEDYCDSNKYVPTIYLKPKSSIGLISNGSFSTVCGLLALVSVMKLYLY